MSIALDLQQPDAVTATTGSVETRGDGSNVLRYMVLSALAGYVLVAPNLGVWYSTYSSHNLQRALQLVVLVAVAGYFVAAPGRFKSIIGRLPERAIAIGLGVLGLGLASSALAARPLYGLREVVLYALLTVLTLAVAEVVRIGGSGVDRALLCTFSVSALFYVALFLAIRFADGSGLPAFEARELPSFANVRFFGEFQTLLLPLLSVPLLSLQQHRAIRVLGLVTAAVGFWMLFFVSASRGAMLAIVTAAAYVLWVFGRRAVGWVAATAVSAFAGWMLFVPIVAVQPGHDTDLQKAISLGVSDTGRFDLWQTALARIANSPVLGIGPGHLA
ncbi:MAG: O-antigen ligase family protein, partial [Gemmatimonadetes bacterium]|nr:O-antigen ligase family protein [Gemmatimonadota bacterium]